MPSPESLCIATQCAGSSGRPSSERVKNEAVVISGGRVTRLAATRALRKLFRHVCEALVMKQSSSLTLKTEQDPSNNTDKDSLDE
uniref:Uncharacterized protein n=1 Tax=Oryza punctata TaxID=4537 RepID=A0A0E0MIS2_ORYPU